MSILGIFFISNNKITHFTLTCKRFGISGKNCGMIGNLLNIPNLLHLSHPLLHLIISEYLCDSESFESMKA